MDANGKLVLTSKFMGESVQISTNGLSNGIYLIQCFSKTGTIVGTKKLMVQ